MPYLTLERRTAINLGHPPVNAGELTYELQQALKRFVASKGLGYQTLSECLGALEGAKADLIERVLVPYEQEKKVNNGDVWYDEKGRIV